MRRSRATPTKKAVAALPARPLNEAYGHVPFSTRTHKPHKALACDADQKGRGGFAAAAAKPEPR